MRRDSTTKTAASVLAACIVLQGCATAPVWRPTQFGTLAVKPAAATRRATPAMKVHNTGRWWGLCCGTTIGGLTGLGVAIGLEIKASQENRTYGALPMIGLILGSTGLGHLAGMLVTPNRPAPPGLPDMGQLVLEETVEKARRDVPGCSEMAVSTVPDGAPGPTLVLHVDELLLGPREGLVCVVRATAEAGGGEVVWCSNYRYSSKAEGRSTSMRHYLANGQRLLKDEMRYAARRIAAVIAGRL